MRQVIEMEISLWSRGHLKIAIRLVKSQGPLISKQPFLKPSILLISQILSYRGIPAARIHL